MNVHGVGRERGAKARKRRAREEKRIGGRIKKRSELGRGRKLKGGRKRSKYNGEGRRGKNYKKSNRQREKGDNEADGKSPSPSAGS